MYRIVTCFKIENAPAVCPTLFFSISEFLGVMRTWSCMGGYVHAGSPMDLPESTVKPAKLQNSVSKTVVAGAPDYYMV